MKTNFAASTLRSPLLQGSRLKPFGNHIRKTVVATLALTSLVDAFTILVIYLIVNSSGAEPMDLEKGIQLPEASMSSELDRSPVVIFKDGSFRIDNQIIANENLKASLEQLRLKTQKYFKDGESSIMIQADENVGFEKLHPIMVAAAYAGVKHVKFAVLQKD